MLTETRWLWTAAAVTALTLCACGAEDELQAADLTVGPATAPSGSVATTATGACEAGIVRECRIDLPEQNGVKNCTTGLQACRQGKWGPCQDPAEVDPDGLTNLGAQTVRAKAVKTRSVGLYLMFAAAIALVSSGAAYVLVRRRRRLRPAMDVSIPPPP